MRKLFAVLGTVAAFGAASTAANAATVIYQEGVFGPPSGYTLYSDFNDAAAQSIVTGSDFDFPTGTLSGQHVALPGNDTPYLSVYADGAATISFAEAVRSFSFDYSTVDTYNSIRITYADNGFEDVSGSTLLSTGEVFGQSSGSFVVNGDGRLISKIELTTGSNSFEVDNLAISPNVAAVPEPQTWLMLIAGFGLIGAATRRKARTLATA